jgi:hypothetical protein
MERDYVGEQLSAEMDVVTFNFSHNGVGEAPLDFTELDKFAVNTYSRDMRNKGRAYVFNARTKQQMPLDVEILEDMDEHQERFHIIDRVKHAAVPIVLIQGTEDFQRLRNGSVKMLEANSSMEWIQIPEGNHTFKAVHPFQGTTEPLEAAIRETKRAVLRFMSHKNVG